jgi:PAS domain S-box-containing protein
MALDRARSLAIQEAVTAKNELEDQQVRYRNIVENLGDVLMDFDDQGNCVFVSPNCIDVVGKSEKSFLGSAFLDLLHPDDYEPLLKLYRFSRAHPGATRVLPLRVLHQNNEWLHIQSSSRCYFTEAGKLHFLSIMRNTTDLRIAEMTMRHSDRLKAAGTLSAGIAHQINNPIGSILTAAQYAQIALKDGDLDAVEQALRDNIEQATRCGKIVRSLLHFAAPESPTTGREDLVEVVHRSREFTLSYAGENSIDIAISGHLEPLWVEISAVEIEQVLINLLRNAIESAPTSNRVDVVVSVVDSSVRVEVRDDGRGIAESDRAQIFDPFYTTRIRDGGSGLGLSLSYGIIRDHGGRMEVLSEEGKGTSVSIELPLVGPEPT